MSIEVAGNYLKDLWIEEADGTIIYPFADVMGRFSVNLDGRSKGKNRFHRVSLQELINYFADGKFNDRGSIRMKAEGEKGGGNGRSPTAPTKGAKVVKSPALLQMVEERRRNFTIDASEENLASNPPHDQDGAGGVGLRPSSVNKKAHALSEEDLLKILESQRKNGERGESIAMGWEKSRIGKLGCLDPDKVVTHVSKTDVGAGYDIHSKWTSAEERFIEVKTTASRSNEFFMSENEKQVLSEKVGKSYIYIVELDSIDKTKGLVREPLKFDPDDFEFEPVAYRVRLKSQPGRTE